MTDPYDVYDLNPVDRITADAIGDPGSRVFYLQARKGRHLVTMICEKEHVAALALATDQVLMTLADDDADAVVDPADGRSGHVHQLAQPGDGGFDQPHAARAKLR